MNEQIKLLAERAGFRSNPDIYDRNQSFAEKFAELIVGECTDLVQKYMTRWPEDCELTKQIKEHFGVEE